MLADFAAKLGGEQVFLIDYAAAQPCTVQCPAGSPGCQFAVGAYTYHNLQAGVTLDKVKLRIGIDNVNDKQPPILYQNNSLNGNTDERTYDTVGRYYWSSLTYSF